MSNTQFKVGDRVKLNSLVGTVTRIWEDSELPLEVRWDNASCIHDFTVEGKFCRYDKLPVLELVEAE